MHQKQPEESNSEFTVSFHHDKKFVDAFLKVLYEGPCLTHF